MPEPISPATITDHGGQQTIREAFTENWPLELNGFGRASDQSEQNWSAMVTVYVGLG